MASQNYLQDYSNLGFKLVCDSCYSTEIIEKSQGYVCSQCGIVLNGQKMEYRPSGKAGRIQHAVLDMTQIGNQYERAKNKRSKKFNKLNSLHGYRSNKENIDLRAKLEIRRIVEALHLPLEAKHSIYLLYKYFRRLLTPRSEFRDPET